MKRIIIHWSISLILLFSIQQLSIGQCNIYDHSPANITLGGNNPDEQLVLLSGLNFSCDAQFGYPPFLFVERMGPDYIMISLTDANIISPTNVDIVVLHQGQVFYSIPVLVVPDAPPLNAGSISCQNLTINHGESPGTIQSVQPASGGNCATHSYSWQKQESGSTWISISGASGSTYACPALSKTTSFRRKVVCNGTTAYTSSVTITVSEPSGMVNATNEENYIISYSPQEAVQDENVLSTADVKNLGVSIQYFDGMGRPKQSISVAAGPNEQDIVQPIVYDAFGRERYKLLPYAMGHANNKGAVRNNPDMSHPSTTYTGSEHQTFYNTHEQNTSDKLYAYSEVVFEASPLNRVLEQGAPGAAWQPGLGGHTVKMDYSSNGSGDVLIFQVIDNKLKNSGGEPSGNHNYYAANQLYKTITRDENWEELDEQAGITTEQEKLHSTEEYKDKLGQVVLKRSYVKVDNVVTPVETYYVYDDFGLLRYVMPPQAVANFKGDINDYSTSNKVYWFTGDQSTDNKSNQGTADTYLVDSKGSLTLTEGFTFTATSGSSLTITTANLNDDLMYSYKYDGRKRMIEKKIPGAAPVYMVYDDRDRLVATQDGEMRDNGEWLFTKYDALNRPVMTGVIDNDITAQATMQTAVNSYYTDKVTYPNARFYEERSGSTGNVYSYTNQYSYPSNIAKERLLSITYYDTYGYTGCKSFETVHNISDENTYNTAVKGQVTGTRTKVLDGDEYTANAQWTLSTSYYDKRYRVIQSITDLYPSNGSNKAIYSTNYDFVGKVENTKLVQSFENTTKTITERFAYDHAGRLLKQWHSVDGGATETLLVENSYDMLGQLISKKVGKTSTGTHVQQMDYRYNIRGWMTSINEAQLAGTTADKLFAMRLNYNNTVTNLDGAAQYNGNISAIEWRSPAADDIGMPSHQQGYGFSYDGLNRLLAADYGESSNYLGNSDAFSVSGIDYDLNGNIMALQRHGQVKPSSTWLTGQIDNLSYSYAGNQLQTVSDNAPASYKSYGFKDGNTTGMDYHYDLNGNMISDRNKGLQTVEYNHLNLPSKLTGENNEIIKYIYDANGQKLKKVGVDGTETYYAGNMVYKGNSLDYILHSEGSYSVSGTGNGSGYQYNIKDHLGNVRLVVNSSRIITDQSDYYPFGMLMKPKFSGGIDNLYKYNGKELQDDAIGNGSLDWYDYGARFYDPTIGRFFTQDRFAEKYMETSPYHYALNNPIL
ncbi:MAG: RHS repeat-associated core domain-containing protein, partial [Carboxylicivirga sp.]|nr:RHS repeat-associated core domain-containing protein [Carboxylicivirga sp.]